MKKASLLLILMILPALACATTTSAPLKATSAHLSHPEGAETCTVTAALALNLRAGPGTSYAVLDTLKRGDILTLLPQPAHDLWIAVRAQELEGWVHSTYCERKPTP